jgi:hypothetical protein
VWGRRRNEEWSHYNVYRGLGEIPEKKKKG